MKEKAEKYACAFRKALSGLLYLFLIGRCYSLICVTLCSYTSTRPFKTQYFETLRRARLIFGTFIGARGHAPQSEDFLETSFHRTEKPCVLPKIEAIFM